MLLGNGDGTFQSPITLTAGREPFDLVLGDFNGDGKLDFAVTDFSAGVYVFLGNGDGTFHLPVLFSTGNNPVAIVAHDFNGDAKLDLAVAGFPPGSSGPASTVSIMLGNGDGTFLPPVPYPIDDRGPTSIAAGDLNGDGKTDLAVTTFACAFGLCGSVTSTMLGNGDGTFQSVQTVWFTSALDASIAPFSVHVADFTGSGKADLVEIGGLALGVPSVIVFPGNGNRTFQGPLLFNADQGPLALAVGDLNGDGKPDIVVANHDSNDITILLNATVP